MFKPKKPEERTLTPGSQYHTIYTHVLLNPGIDSQTLTDQLDPILHLNSTEISKRCSRLMIRGYLKKKLVTIKRPKGHYVTEVRWYTTEMAPDDIEPTDEHLWRPEVNEATQKTYEINCFKVEELMKLFNHKRFQGTDTGCARDLAKHDLKLIDKIYDTIFKVDSDMTVRLTYYPIIDTIEDQYELIFELFYNDRSVGHLSKVRYDPDHITFWFHFKNKMIGIKFRSVAYASRTWGTLKKQLAKKYEALLEEDTFSLIDLLE